MTTQDDDIDFSLVEHALENDRATKTVLGDCSNLEKEVDRLKKEIAELREQRSQGADIDARILELELRDVQDSLRIAQRAKARL